MTRAVVTITAADGAVIRGAGKCGEMTGRDGYAVALAIGELNPHFQ